MKSALRKDVRKRRSKTRSTENSEPSWVGRDVLRDFHGRRFSLRLSLPLILAGVAAALALVVLRSDVQRIRYALSEAMTEERRLLEKQRAYTVHMRTLRAPGRLVQLARKQGFTRPEWIIYLEEKRALPGDEAMP